MHSNPRLPNYGCDVHPMFSAAMHDECGSKLEQQCDTLNVSIHDRDEHGGASIKFTERDPFPYEGVSSQRGTTLGTMVDRASLLRACHLSIVFTSKNKHAAVEIRRNGDALILSCAGDHGVDENSIEAPAEDVQAKVSAEKLSSALGKLTEGKVRLIATPNAVFIESGEMLMVVGLLR